MRVVIIFLVLFIFSKIQSQEILFIDTEINADGILDEPVWSELTPFNQFSNFFPINDGPAQLDTDVYVYQDGKYLNIGFVYHDTLKEVRVNSMKRDDYGPGFHLSDCVGVIIDPYSNQNRGYFFAVNGEGSQLDALIANYDNDNLSWDALWESGQSVDGTDKIYELKIPLSSFSYDEHISKWNFQFYTRDAKDRMYTVWNKFERGFLQFDTRFLKSIELENLKTSRVTKTTLIPSLTTGYQKDLLNKTTSQFLQPSLDVQYKITDGLRIDATLNPDFSQVEVDQQVTNLTRFNIVFPERRNFFIENSDMFTTLGAANDINPFYSRFIGASQDILFGLKLSGNISPNTRIGLLNVQGKRDTSEVAQNYAVAVVKQQFGPIFNATAYFINTQTTNNFSLQDDYNRIGGLKVNYLSKNRKWSGFGTISNSFNDQVDGDAHVFSVENNYNTRTLSFSSKISTVGRNYFTDIGFVPRLDNFDPITSSIIRAGYTQLFQSVFYNHYPNDQKIIQTFRPLNASASVYLDESGEVYETNYFYNTALFFSNLMSVYVNLYHERVGLKYGFDPLRNGDLILPGNFCNSAIRVGFNSDYTRNFYGSVNFQIGSFFGGDRNRFAVTSGYRLLPWFSLSVNYEYNDLSFDEKGSQGLHLLGLTTEVFFNNKFNWTTYIQYNEQIDNININSRLQWEYQPLSFIYLVYSDNYTEVLGRKNWGVSLKVNKRFNF